MRSSCPFGEKVPDLLLAHAGHGGLLHSVLTIPRRFSVTEGECLLEVEVDVRAGHGLRSDGCTDDAAACSRKWPTRPITPSGTRRPMAPLEYTLTITLPCGSSTKPVDCRYSGSSLTNAPVSAATARASALCPSG